MIRTYLPGVLAMAIVVVASNILVQFLCGQWLTWGAFTYPFTFLVTDLTNRVFGVRVAKRVVLAGFVVGLICSLIGTQIDGAYGPLVTARVAFASLTAFVVGQLMDIFVFNAMRRRVWWQGPILSSLIGSALDSIIFFSLAFAAALTLLGPAADVAWANEMLPILGVGPRAPLWVSLGVADWGVKLALVLVSLLPYRAVVRKVTVPLA
ncbi:queuosine precursor transporter [Acidimangrovimonas sediminis]|uniref:queuosine precursor transporter n=1 Tax=Acidimangrovimonas sediminis TaxID=2056283 RepID=UPI000C7FEBAC|nr:queuosine precursor transporter [Acidimangrovimonas sediminis]